MKLLFAAFGGMPQRDFKSIVLPKDLLSVFTQSKVNTLRISGDTITIQSRKSGGETITNSVSQTLITALSVKVPKKYNLNGNPHFINECS